MKGKQATRSDKISIKGSFIKTKYLSSNYLRVNAQVFLSLRFVIHKT